MYMYVLVNNFQKLCNNYAAVLQWKQEKAENSEYRNGEK